MLLALSNTANINVWIVLILITARKFCDKPVHVRVFWSHIALKLRVGVYSGKLSVLWRSLFGEETILNDSCVPLIPWRAGISHPGHIECLVEGYKSRPTQCWTALQVATYTVTPLQVATHSVTPRHKSRHTHSDTAKSRGILCDTALQVATHTVTPLQVATHSMTPRYKPRHTLWHRPTSRDTHNVAPRYKLRHTQTPLQVATNSVTPLYKSRHTHCFRYK